MNLIKLSDKKIIDIDTVTVYSTHAYTDNHGNQIMNLFITQPNGEGMQLSNDEAETLWRYLEAVAVIVGYGQ